MGEGGFSGAPGRLRCTVVIMTVSHCSRFDRLRTTSVCARSARSSKNGDDCSSELRSIGEVARNNFKNPISISSPSLSENAMGGVPPAPYPIVKEHPARREGSALPPPVGPSKNDSGWNIISDSQAETNLLTNPLIIYIEVKKVRIKVTL
jgi:hypothetical protein